MKIFITKFEVNVNILVLLNHSRPQRPRSFWSAPKMTTSGFVRFLIRDSRTSGRSAHTRRSIYIRIQARMSLINVFQDALIYGLEILGLSDTELKEKRYEALKAVVLRNRDVFAVLPTGNGKSLSYQLLPLVLHFFKANGSPMRKSTVIVISSLNALIRDQIVKLQEGGLNVCALKGDRVASTRWR